jgi:hypothetical protein
VIFYQDNFLEASVHDGGYRRSCQIAELIGRSGVEVRKPGAAGHSLSSLLRAVATSLRVLGLHRGLLTKERLASLSWAIANLQSNRSVQAVVSERFARFPANFLAATGRVPIVAVPQNIESLVPGQPPYIVSSPELNRKAEMKMLRMAQFRFCIAAEDAAILQAEGFHAEILPYFPDAERMRELGTIRSERLHSVGNGPVLVLGSVTNPPTMQATRQLLEVLADVRATATTEERRAWPDVVVAGNGTEKLTPFAGDKVQVRGRLDDEELRHLLICARCLLVNTVPTTGALTRVTEALVAGLTVATVRAASRGQPRCEGLLLHESLADVVRSSLTNAARTVPEQPPRPAEAERVFIETLRGLDPVVSG